MTTYIIVDIDVKDPVRYEDYKKLTPGSLEPFEGRFIVRGGATEVLEGNPNPKRVVVLQFPSRAQAKAWWESDVYAPAKALRQQIADTNMFLVEEGPTPSTQA